MQLQTKITNGSTIVLRPPREADVAAIYEGASTSREELAPWMPWCHENFCVDDVTNWVRETTGNDAESSFTIWDEAEQKYFGNCGLHEIHAKLRSAKMGYWVRTSEVGQGIATAVARTLAEYAFNELELVRLAIEIGIGNEPSHRVAEKLNATREGVTRNSFLHGDEPVDMVLYSLIPADLANLP